MQLLHSFCWLAAAVTSPLLCCSSSCAAPAPLLLLLRRSCCHGSVPALRRVGLVSFSRICVLRAGARWESGERDYQEALRELCTVIAGIHRREVEELVFKRKGVLQAEAEETGKMLASSASKHRSCAGRLICTGHDVESLERYRRPWTCGWMAHQICVSATETRLATFLPAFIRVAVGDSCGL